MRALLRSVWAEPRVADPPTRVWRDWVLLGAVWVAATVEGLLRTDLVSPAYSLIVALVLAPTLLRRRTRPLLMVAVAFPVTAVAALLAGHEPELVTGVYLLTLPYALYRWGSGRQILAGTAIILAKMGLSAAGHLGLADVVGGTVVVSAAMAVATALRYRATLWARELDQAKSARRTSPRTPESATSPDSPAGRSPDWSSTSPCTATSTTSRRPSRPRSTGWPRSR
ncbi:hypothetical protein [Micromonospora sp. LOL_021]|uniref:hypothetical protein n=1 Tax=Micromonospora sp. LOL_021 TaxID=3345417 RepID=UPI003A85EDBD